MKHKKLKPGDLIQAGDEVLDITNRDSFFKGKIFHPVPLEMIGTAVTIKTPYIRRELEPFDLGYKALY